LPPPVASGSPNGRGLLLSAGWQSGQGEDHPDTVFPLDGESGSVPCHGLAQQRHAGWMPTAGGVRTVLFHPAETGDVAVSPLHGVDESHVRHLAGQDGVPKGPLISLAN
jgi:hypothetical protein